MPVHTYEQLYRPYIEQMLRGVQNVLWPTPVRWFAKSSGTTNDRSKYIPVSAEALQAGHYKAGKDLLAIYLRNYPDSRLMLGKSLGVGGSLSAHPLSAGTALRCGDISAVLMQNLPRWAQWRRVPSLRTALMDQWEEKIECIVQATATQNVTSLAGVPTWVHLIVQKMLATTGKDIIHEVWPGLELFIHGGVAFGPYKALFQTTAPRGLRYMEVYNASEGFFAVQDQPQDAGMLLLPNHGIYYEFVPLAELDKAHPRAVPLADVVLGEVYALVISTNAGLWRYQIGDTVQFTSLNPCRIKIAGRTKQFINAFGEELMVDNAERAITQACLQTGATLRDYTAAPRYMDQDQQQGAHEWIIEFVKPPDDLARFAALLDATLQAVNTDYEAKRTQDLALGPPIVHAAPAGTFYEWLKRQGKLGRQHKVPRLANHRRYLEDLLAVLQQQLL